jgi:hypothetical protein
MQTNSPRKATPHECRNNQRLKERRRGPRTYGYYRCPHYVEHGGQGCTNRRMLSTETLETKAWRFVRSVMTDPEELAVDLDLDRIYRAEARGRAR